MRPNQEAKEDAQKIFTSYHNLIQDIGGDYGQEILVSILAKECALIALNKILTIKANIEVPKKG